MRQCTYIACTKLPTLYRGTDSTRQHQQTLGYLGNQSRRRADEGRSEVPDEDFYGEVGEAGGVVV